jgi:hypothetical protein
LFDEWTIFPDGPGVIAAAVIGWLIAAVISLVVQGLKLVWLLLARL